jgi:hypothetical protein
MKTKCLISLAFLAALLNPFAPAFAHHGAAALDENTTVTFNATITSWVWANPHCIIHFDVTDDAGKVAHWASETSPPIGMVQLGWHRDTLRPGDHVTIVLHAAKSRATVGRTVYVVLANGKKLIATPDNDRQAAPLDDSEKKSSY